MKIRDKAAVAVHVSQPGHSKRERERGYRALPSPASVRARGVFR
jgi:hypothetical protein